MSKVKLLIEIDERILEHIEAKELPLFMVEDICRAIVEADTRVIEPSEDKIINCNGCIHNGTPNYVPPCIHCNSYNRFEPKEETEDAFWRRIIKTESEDK